MNRFYDCKKLNAENLHIYCHSRKDGKDGCVYLIINNSATDSVSVEIPKEANVYGLSVESLRSSVMKLNGKELNNIDDIVPEHRNQGKISLAPATCTFVVL